MKKLFREYYEEVNVPLMELVIVLKDMEDISYESIDKVMRSISKKHDITPKKLHDDFVERFGVIPDGFASNWKNRNITYYNNET